MSIKENQLPTAQEVTENNLIRTVDENGASQNMTVEQLGGLVGDNGIFILHEDKTTALDKTFGEIKDAFENEKIIVIFPLEDASDYPPYPTMMIVVGIDDLDTPNLLFAMGLLHSGTYMQFDKRVYYATTDESYPSWDA